MIQFNGGPANDVILHLARTPVMLRVVRGPGGNWDALDQLDDTPADEEELFLYRIVGVPMRGFICSRGKGGRGGQLVSARYQFVADQPADEDMRTNDRWAAWCEALQRREQATKAQTQEARS